MRSDLTSRTLQAWLLDQLFVDADAALQTQGALDKQNCPQTEQLASLIDEWGLSAWVREASREDYG
jgi:hypothetical protein